MVFYKFCLFHITVSKSLFKYYGPVSNPLTALIHEAATAVIITIISWQENPKETGRYQFSTLMISLICSEHIISDMFVLFIATKNANIAVIKH